MGRHSIYCLIGKSGSGKDTIYKELAGDPSLALGHIVPCTTRPMRAEEKDGREYYFYSEEEFRKMLADGAVIEHRCYQTVHGPWYYFTADDGQIDLSARSTLLIGTLESYKALARWFGDDGAGSGYRDGVAGDGSEGDDQAGSDSEKVVKPIYVEVEDGLRLQRLLDRERAQEVPRYREMCRRFLADSEDFSEEKIAEAGITRRFVNEDLDVCLKEIKEYIKC